MKKYVIFILFLCIIPLCTIQAQTTKEKGFFIEASAAYGSTHYKEYAIITPTVGYQFNKHWSAGMKVGFETGHLAYTIYTPFVRFNFLNIKRLHLFTEAQFNILDREADGGQSGYSEVGLSFGATYSVCKHLNLIGHYLFVGYSAEDRKEGAWLGKKDFALDANARRFQLGLQYIF